MFLLFLLFTDFLHPINNKVVMYEVTTGDRYLDSGGEGQYLNCTAPLDNQESCTSTAMLCGDGSISITFTEFSIFPSIGIGGDHLSIYSGTKLLYTSNAGISAKGMTFTDTSGCLMLIFTTTSAYAMQGWAADIIVTGTVFESPPEEEDRQCNLVCKSNVYVEVQDIISFSVLDFIMNPGTCLDQYSLMFIYPENTNVYIPGRILDSTHKGLKFEYKVGTTYRGIKNYCWGYINVK